MGCCTSSTAKRSEDTRRSPPHTHKGTHIAAAAAGKALAPPDEETVVKEVLSETPISKPPPPTHHHHHQQQQQRNTHIVPILHPQQPPQTQQPQLPQNFVSTSINNDDDNNANVNVSRRKTEQREEKTPEVSQASEICSVTDTLSTATTATTTTTVTEIRDEEATSKKRVVNRSPGKVPRKRPYTGDRVSKPPARRQLSAAAGGRREVYRGATNGVARRDIGEGSGRRSRSPATRVAGGVGRGRGVGSPAKVTGGAGSRLVDREVNKKEEKNDGVSVEQQPNESLENPLVSLECFIFL